MTVRAENIRQVGCLNVDVEDVEAIATQQGERQCLRKLVPEFLESQSGLFLSPLPKDVDHLAEGADCLAGEPCCDLFDQNSDGLLEPLGRRDVVMHESSESFGGISIGQQP